MKRHGVTSPTAHIK